MNPYWPLFELRLFTPRLELRYPTDDDALELARVAAGGIHDDSFLPFSRPWSTLPSPLRERDVLRQHWNARGSWSPESWVLPFVVVHEGSIVGTQGLSAEQFSLRRVVATGSWLGKRHQGRGLGTEMRAAVLELAFGHLGAQRAYTSAHADNGRSLAVSRKLGYIDNGDEIRVRDGRATREIRMILERDRWTQHRVPDISVRGLEPCLEMFGVGEAAVDG